MLRLYVEKYHKCFVELTIKDSKLVRVECFDTPDFQQDFARFAISESCAKSCAKAWTEKTHFFDQKHWWFNGHLLCNTRARWSNRNMDRIVEMIQASCSKLPKNISKTILLNRRDYPWLRHDRQMPFPFLTEKVDDKFLEKMQRPLSFYSGPAWEDICIPVPETWTVWEDTQECRKLSFAERKTKIVFRGTLTGQETDERNPRIAACRILSNNKFADVALTDWTVRERVTSKIEFPPPIDHSLLGRKMSIKDQCSYKFLLYIEGHVAASRLAWHLCSGSIVLAIKHTTSANTQWFTKHFRETCSVFQNGFFIADSTEWFECTIQDLPRALEFLVQMDEMEPEVLSRIASKCVQRAQNVFQKNHMMLDIARAMEHC